MHRRTLRFFFSISFSFWLLSASWAVPRGGGWPHDGSDLEPDPTVTWGTLDNGLRYVLKPHSGASGQIDIRLLVLTGSIDEKPNELGVAHFTEHMAFNGTRNYDPGELSQYFQSLGMDYGYDVNAFTSADHTIYILELPENSESQINEGLRILRDFSDGIEFDPAEIDRERGVILSEMRGRVGMEMRSELSAQQLVFRGHKFPERLPIGTEERILNMTRDDFLGFYRRNYRSDNMIVIAAGDFSSARMEAKIAAAFADMRRPSTPLPERDMGRVDAPRGFRAGLYQISNIGSATIQAFSVDPMRRPEPDSLKAREERFQRNLSMMLFADRINSMLEIPAQGGGSYETLYDTNITRAGLQTQGRLWKEGITALDQLIRFTLKEGFSEEEFSWFRKRQLFELRKMKDQLASAPPSAFGEAIQESLIANQVFLGLERDMDLQIQYIDDISTRRLNRAFKEIWELDELVYHVSGDVRIPNGTKDILDEVKTSRDSRGFFMIPISQKEVDYKPRDWGAPGKVVEERVVEDFGATLVRFDNNVRLNHIYSDREPGLVYATVRVGGGIFDLPPTPPGLREFGLQTLLNSGVARFSPEELGAIITANLLNFSLNLNDHDAFTFNGLFGREEFTTFLGITTEFLMEPRFSSYVNRQAKMSRMMSMSGSGVGIGGGMARAMNMVFKDDNRFTQSDPKEVMRVGVFDVQSWIEPAFQNGYFEVSIIGDISKADAVRQVARTFGALPDRRTDKRNPRPQMPVDVRVNPGIYRVEFLGEPHLALVNGTWPITMDMDFRDMAAVYLLTSILENRINQLLREDLGLAYSPSADFNRWPEYPAFAMIQANIDCAPRDTQQISRAVFNLSRDIAQNGVEAWEYELALKHMEGHFRNAWDSNSFLLDIVLKRAQEDPKFLRHAREFKSGLFKEISMDELNSWAARILGADNIRVFNIRPKPFVGIFQENEQGSRSGNIIGGVP
jgi:zinc protease